MYYNIHGHTIAGRILFLVLIGLFHILLPMPGSTSDVTKHAHKMAAACEQELKTLEKELEQLEAEINPVLDDNAVVALCYLLSKSVDVMKSVDQVSYNNYSK